MFDQCVCVSVWRLLKVFFPVYLYSIVFISYTTPPDDELVSGYSFMAGLWQTSRIVLPTTIVQGTIHLRVKVHCAIIECWLQPNRMVHETHPGWSGYFQKFANSQQIGFSILLTFGHHHLARRAVNSMIKPKQRHRRSRKVTRAKASSPV